tara:strand:+ start:219 stop:653 length:435 start_codon:yes stop_codon:yes gene_type:complete
MSLDWTAVDNKTPIFSLEGTKHLCKVVNVYDGDTCKVVFPFADKMCRWNVRLTGYDTPEMRPPRNQENREEEKKAAYAARNFLRSKVMNDDQLVYIKCGEFDKYGRLLGTLYLRENDENSINDLMIQEGHGYVYDGGTKKKFVD